MTHPQGAAAAEPTLKPCPFCNWQAGADLIDVVYPTGGYAHWLDPADHSQGLHFNSEDAGAVHRVYHVGCTENMGGCGASVLGLGRDGAIAAWNRRAPTDARNGEVEGLGQDKGSPASPVPLPVGYASPSALLDIAAGRTLTATLVHVSEADLEPGGDVPLYASPAVRDAAWVAETMRLADTYAWTFAYDMDMAIAARSLPEDTELRDKSSNALAARLAARAALMAHLTGAK